MRKISIADIDRNCFLQINTVYYQLNRIETDVHISRECGQHYYTISDEELFVFLR